MHPYLFEVPTSGEPFRVPAYGMMMLLAFVLAFFLLNTRSRSIGVPAEKLIPIFGAAAVGGLVGARLLYLVAVQPQKTFSDPLSVLDCGTGGFAIYGGLIGGAAAVIGVLKLQGLPMWKMLDILAPSVILGMGIGRIGCFFAGCCHGAVMPAQMSSVLVAPGFLHGTIYSTSHFPFFATEFVDPSSVTRHELLGLALYPTQLLDMLGLLMIVVLSQALWRFRRFDGQIMAIAFLVQAVLRIVIESYRADQRGYAFSWAVEQAPAWLPPGLLQAGGLLPKVGAPVVVGITTSQGIGLGIVAACVAVLIARRGTGVAPEVALEEDRG